MPSLFTVGGYRVFFWSNELGEPVHVHICRGKPSPDATKIWLTRQGGCIVAHNRGRIPSGDLNVLLDVIAAEHSSICKKWSRFFMTDSLHFYC